LTFGVRVVGAERSGLALFWAHEKELQRFRSALTARFAFFQFGALLGGLQCIRA
jgi:hypothetical protein